jgi:hypothetical protein
VLLSGKDVVVLVGAKCDGLQLGQAVPEKFEAAKVLGPRSEANRGDSARGHADPRFEGEMESMRDDLDNYLIIVDASENRICFLSSLTLFTLTACTPPMA